MTDYSQAELNALLRPRRSDRGRELLSQWIERSGKYWAMLPTVAALIRGAFSPQQDWRSSYKKVSSRFLSDPLVLEFESLRTGATKLAFGAARADIEADQAFRERLLEAGKLNQSRLLLDSELSIPRYVTAPRFHWQPYVASSSDYWEEQFLGLIWRVGTENMGFSDPNQNEAGLGSGMIDTAFDYVRSLCEGFRPRRILDIGCSAGGSTIAAYLNYPDAEIWGIDVSSAMLRAGHAVANLLEMPVSFSQQNAEATNFADGYFDLITSQIVFHELPNHIKRRIIRECARLLAPGGFMAHIEGGTYEDPPDGFGEYWRESACRTNNEWYAKHASLQKLRRYIHEAGLEDVSARVGPPSQLFGHEKGSFLLIGGRKQHN